MMDDLIPAFPQDSQTPGEADFGLELSVVMPCLDEARTVGRCVEKARRALAELGVAGEVIVADNGSTDGSPEIARACGARLADARETGYGAALQAGIAAAHGRYIIMGDADDSYDFSRLGPLLERLRQGDDLVVGNRFRGGILPGAMPWLHRYVGNPLLTGILNLFYRSPIRDAHCGLRGFRKESYRRLGLTSRGMEFASEMVVKACLHRLRMSEVPVVLHPDGRDRRPHLRSFRDGWRHLRLLLLLCPLWLYLIPAGALMTVGVGLFTWQTHGPHHIAGVSVELHMMLLGSLCVLLAYQTLWLWAYAKIFGWTSGLLPRETFPRNVFHYFNLERGLVFGAGLLAAGVGIDLHSGMRSWELGPGGIDVQSVLRAALWGSTLIVLGVQTISGSFLLSMLGMVDSPNPRQYS